MVPCIYVKAAKGTINPSESILLFSGRLLKPGGSVQNLVLQFKNAKIAQKMMMLTKIGRLFLEAFLEQSSSVQRRCQETDARRRVLIFGSWFSVDAAELL